MSLLEESSGGPMRSVPHRLMCLDSWSLVSDAAWEGYGIFRRCSFGGGSELLREGLEGFYPHFISSSLSWLQSWG